MRFTALLLLLPAIPVCAQQTSVLFIGNSYVYTNDLPNTFQQLALSLGEDVTVASSAPGGFTLYEHGTYVPTISLIESQPWTYVVMQEQSQLGALPVDVTDTEIGAALLVANIEQNDECTYPVFFMTWGRQNGDDLNCPDFPFMCTYDGMQEALRDNYVALAENNDAYVSPVGVAWKQVRDTQPQINLYQPDGSHPSAEGTYLAASVFYCTLFQESCAGASFTSTLDAGTAAILRAIASAVVLDSMSTWNLDVTNGTDATYTGYSSDGPADITYYHSGAGTHLWTCSNGQSSTENNATFTFTESGIYTFTHTYNDPCGNTDTVTWTVEITIVGVSELEDRSPYQVLVRDGGQLEVRGGTGGETLSLSDVSGRTILSRALDATVERLTCPPGLHAFRIVDRTGAVWSGKVLVPWLN